MCKLVNVCCQHASYLNTIAKSKLTAVHTRVLIKSKVPNEYFTIMQNELQST